MQKLMNVLIVNRSSIVKGAQLSRSVEERLFEPLTKLANDGKINVRVTSDQTFSLEELDNVDRIVLNRPHSSASLRVIRAAKEAGVPVYLDIDDLPIFFPEGDSAYLNPEKKAFFLEGLALGDCIVCSTPRIREWMSREFPEKRLETIGTGIDFRRIESLTPKTNPFHEKTMLMTNAGSLKLGAFDDGWVQSIHEVLNKYGWKLGIFTDFRAYIPADMPVLDFGSVPWLQHKIMMNAAFPLAVVPLAASEDLVHLGYSQYKTPIKYILNGGFGIPCVYSKSPIYTDVVEHRRTGLLCENSVKGWTEALSEMIEDQSLRETIRLSALNDVREKFSIERSASGWLDTFVGR